MIIRFDYSWIGENGRSEIAPLDPTPGDFAITQDDFLELGLDRFQQVLNVAQRYTAE